MRPVKLEVWRRLTDVLSILFPLTGGRGGREHHRLPSFSAHQWSPTEGSCWRPLKTLWHGKEGVGLLGVFAEGGGGLWPACHGHLGSTSDSSVLIDPPRGQMPYWGSGEVPERTSTRVSYWPPGSIAVRPARESTLAIQSYPGAPF